MNSLPKVQAQYEDYPYPAREPRDEQRRLLAPLTECLDVLNHYGFGGKKNFHHGFRTLIAGGGTGDSVIFLAEQLRDTNADIIYLDISQRSMEIAQARAKTRNLTNITWHHASLLDAPSLNLGTFDYINCIGVLHHLQDPDASLAALKKLLKQDGVMGLMVYGEIGRTGVYHMQQLMRMIEPENATAEEKITDCKTVIDSLPATNWYKHNATFLHDLSYGDIGIYDLFLHSQDRAYTVPQLYAFVERAGLHINTLLGANWYDPGRYIKDEALLKKIRALETPAQQAIGELISGAIKQHMFYATPQPVAEPSHEDLSMVPRFPVSTPPAIYPQLAHALENMQGSKKPLELKINAGSVIRIPHHPAMPALMQQLDGVKSLQEIYDQGSQGDDIKRKHLQEAFSLLYQTLNAQQIMLLSHRDLPAFSSVEVLQSRMSQR